MLPQDGTGIQYEESCARFQRGSPHSVHWRGQVVLAKWPSIAMGFNYVGAELWMKSGS